MKGDKFADIAVYSITDKGRTYFWAGLFERIDGSRYKAGKITFGADAGVIIGTS